MQTFYSTALLAGVAFLVGFAILFNFVLTLRTIAFQHGKFDSKPFRLSYKTIEKTALKFFILGNVFLGAIIAGTFAGLIWLSYDLPIHEIFPPLLDVLLLIALFIAAVFCFFAYLLNCWRLLKTL